ncbi:MAG: hypothetical protein ACYTBP_11050 [Planctomycetota bacterium]
MAKKVIVALLLPLLIFICTTVVAEAVLNKLIGSKALVAVTALVISLSITFAAMLIIKIIEKQVNKNR